MGRWRCSYNRDLFPIRCQLLNTCVLCQLDVCFVARWSIANSLACSLVFLVVRALQPAIGFLASEVLGDLGLM